ncbi:MAG: Asp23/Gls24 family envelope stress response protein [Lachnospiraceae bacterium]|nr:Asp23/Gls24 family envelope stress response protein [Lachnospiraceae bacterium]
METNNLEVQGNSEIDVIGSVQIADDVVAMIGALAASEVEGVTLTQTGAAGEGMGKQTARKMLKNVKVDVAGQMVSVVLSICIDYGYQIPQTCASVQNKVKSAIETMTGLTVTDVNVRVAKVQMQ